MFVVKRSLHNPILVPRREHYWEAFATFNPNPIKFEGKTHILYRAISLPDSLQTPKQISVIGVAASADGAHFEERKPFVVPEKDWEKYGCEDPRVTFFEGKFYTFYTALSVFPFGPSGIKVGVAISSDLTTVEEKHLVTPFNAKAMTLFPERINGKVVAMLTAHTDEPPNPPKIIIVEADNVSDFWNEAYWQTIDTHIDTQVIDSRRTQYDHVEVGAVPIKTDEGWLLIYSNIQNYYQNPDHYERAFGIEALLLDLNDPRKIIGSTKGPLLIPEEPYELAGYVSNIVFPSGALVEGDILEIYYGAADTTGCVARVNLSDLLCTINPKTGDDYTFKRFAGNPILKPDPSRQWEAQAVFNPAVIDIGGKTHLLYRALSEDNVSTMGYAATEDGVTISERLSEPVYMPRVDFEMKKIPGANSGCEDPRLTQIGNTIYVCYTAFDGIGPPRVAVASISESDFLAHRFQWSEPLLITPRGVDDKDTCILSELIDGKYMIMHRIGTDICADYLPDLNFTEHMVNKCIRILGPRIGTWDSAKVGITAPPIKTDKGWLLLYHAVSKNHHTYRLGFVLLDLKDPTIVLARSTDAIFEPLTDYEKEGIVRNVVFPCGMVVRDGLLYIYYGGADKVIGVATMRLEIILNSLQNGANL